ncbi:hypothetical protein Cni_G14769 [Canna indica]|uniref:WD repeat-containing protein 44 n=1 Tax=Canna indica TaxID=4628 RepID=A0AAQ3KCQ4_9LILI|nr:hypothetical protein Cni_G14769 [Canna indica]
MTTSGHNSQKEEEKEEDAGEEDEFYESLDRILSSSCSSTSASASDDESSAAVAGRRRRSARLRFPPLPSLDVWFAEPASVEERRRRLLCHLGLAGDPSLARPPRAGAGARADMGRSISCDCLRPRANPASAAAVTRSWSNGSVDKTLPQQQLDGPIDSRFSSNPPLDPRFRPLSTGVPEVPDGDRRIDGEDISTGPRCLIKNLDNGSEFVVKEFREDGMWNTLSEVGTGRQLTMEEFDMCVGRSPIVQELMRRQNAEEAIKCGNSCPGPGIAVGRSTAAMRSKKRLGWLRSMKNVAGTVLAGGSSREPRNRDAKDSLLEKGGRKMNSPTDGRLDCSNVLHHGLKRIKVRHYGKSHKELNGLYMCQEIQAHNGSIWSIKFSLDGQYLASAGEDRVIHVWKVSEIDRRGQYEKASQDNERKQPERNRRARVSGSRRSVYADPSMVPEYMLSLSEKPACSFLGHLDDVLDLSWSKNQYLLSSSMDKTVRLWHMSNNYCLKVFSHSDYVTCIQFNPVDDRYFISGSLDKKVRIWCIPDRQVVDWNDLHEMVTAACYTPDGQGALVGSHKGNCHLYDTSDNKLLQKSQVDLQNRKKKSRHKKITGFQFAPGNSSKVLITSADSRIRVIDDNELVHKFKGFRNTSSQISACLTSNGKHVICASEDSHVYVWRYDDSRASRSKDAATISHSYEHFHCEGVTVAIPWPNSSTQKVLRTCCCKQCGQYEESRPGAPLAESKTHQISPSHTHCCTEPQQHSTLRNSNTSRFSDRVSATWPEELMTIEKQSSRCNAEFCSGGMTAEGRSGWASAIVTAGRSGEIRSYQKFWLSNSNMRSAAM